MNNFISGDIKPNQAQIHSTKPIYLLNGEQAYISNIEFGLTYRNGARAYVLTRPKVNQSAIVFGPSQGSDVKIYNTKNGNTNVSIISLTQSESGQGSMYVTNDFVYFNGWMPKTIATAKTEDHSGACYSSRDNKKEDIVLNLQAKTYTKTAYKSKSCPEKYSLVSKKTNPFVFVTNANEANQPFSVRIVEGFHGEGPWSWNEERIIPSMTFKENGEVIAYYFSIDEHKKVEPFEYRLVCKSKKFVETSQDDGGERYVNIFEKDYVEGTTEHIHHAAIYTYNIYCK